MIIIQEGLIIFYVWYSFFTSFFTIPFNLFKWIHRPKMSELTNIRLSIWVIGHLEVSIHGNQFILWYSNKETMNKLKSWKTYIRAKKTMNLWIYSFFQFFLVLRRNPQTRTKNLKEKSTTNFNIIPESSNQINPSILS